MNSTIKRINLRNNHFFVTHDNWKTFEYQENGSIVGTPEENRDIITEIKIRHLLGDKYGFYIIDQLKKIQEQFGFSTGEGYGEAFEVFAMSTILNNDNYNDIYDENIVQGSMDGGIDAIVFDDHNVTLYQIKTDYAQDFSEIHKKMEINYNKYLDNRELTNDELKDLNIFLRKNNSKVKAGLNLNTITICNNRGKDYTPLDIYNMYLKNNFLNKSNNMVIKLRADSDSKVAKIGDTGQAYAFFINAKKFIDNILSNKIINHDLNNLNKLFYDNVRGQLKENEEMAKTILFDANNFVLYNNGITITGDINYLPRTNEFVINEPVISNGQQTLWNLVNYLETEQLSKIHLLIYIKNTNQSSQIKNNISRYTNTQTNIKPIDLLSLNHHIRTIQEDIACTNQGDSRYFLNINTSGNRGYEKKLSEVFDKTNIIKLSDFCRLYYSTEDNNVGSWKNSISSMIKSKMGKIKRLDIDKSLQICKIIADYNLYLSTIKDKDQKSIVSTAGLAMMYISYVYNIDICETKKIIDKLNDKYFFKIDDIKKRPSKLIDIYKTDDIVKKISSIIEDNSCVGV